MCVGGVGMGWEGLAGNKHEGGQKVQTASYKVNKVLGM